MSHSFKLACLQMNSGSDLAANLSTLEQMVATAAAEGAHLVMAPEYALLMDGSGRVMRDGALPADGGDPLVRLQILAARLKVWLLPGSLTLQAGEGRMVNRSYLIDDGGSIVASYDKIHMFDVTLPDGKVIRESSAYQAGERAVIAQTPWGALGMSICYDLRFPQLYRQLAKAGAQFLSIPSSFQRQTGRAHWHTLLRARAIENAAYVFAPAMCGEHGGGRQTYGHALIVDPWGEVLADGGEEPGIVYADIDASRVARIRSMMPCLEHDRTFSAPEIINNNQ